MRTIQVEILITAPNGCDSAIELLKCLDNQINPSFKIKVLEASGNCSPTSFSPANFQVEHVYFNSHEEARMRRDAFIKSNADWIMVLEDHILISPNFISEFQRFIEHNSAPDATTFYAINGTSGSFGSRALFSWVWGLAESSLYPGIPEPVCSAFAVKKSAVMKSLARHAKELEVGELETKIIPGLINSCNSKFITHMEISHFEYVGITVGAKAIYSNARIMGHLERSLLSWRDWNKTLLLRFSLRPKQIHQFAAKGFMEMAYLYLVALVAFTGFLIGGLFGIGKADVHLASAHPKIHR
jgi:hypothetical protein